MPGGECWTQSQCTARLKKADFAPIDSHADIPGTMPGTTLIVAEKK